MKSTSSIDKKKQTKQHHIVLYAFYPNAFQETGGDSVVTAIKEIIGGGSTGKVSISTSSSSSPSSSATATGGEEAYGEETSPYDNYDGYGNYETYYDESTASPDGSQSVTIGGVSVGTGGKVDLGLAASIDLETGTGSKVITTGGGSSVTINRTKILVG